jgi:PLP dependent protein
MITSHIKDNYELIDQKIILACQRANRLVDEIVLVAVSKTKPVEDIFEAVNLGMRHFGENKPQEIRDKYKYFEETHPLISQQLHWHMIGNIQKNKIKYIIETCELIHSVDSMDLIQALNEAAQKRHKIIQILLQVNISMEQSKNGFNLQELYEVLPELKQYRHIQVMGLMTIPPIVDEGEKNRRYFRHLKEVFIDIKTKNIDNVYMNFLSMGMTDDFEVAIEEGATHIRVGTGIFGHRA